MSIIVQKFGGTSVANAERIKRVADRVANYYRQGHKMVVVLSARGDTTDELIMMARELTSKPDERELDMLMATGEQQSIAFMAMAIKELGLPVISLTGPQVGILTDNAYTKARILDVSAERLISELDKGKVVIVAGFQGMTADNNITTLGRGGSDTTAVAVAAAIKADMCEIYTDVDGVYTADPRVVPDARKLDFISFDEMLELASLGALVLQPRAVEFAKQYQVKLHVRSSFNYNEGTIVQEGGSMEKDIVVSGVAHDLNVAKIGLFAVPDRPGIAHRLFSTLAAAHVNVDMIVQSAMRDGQNDIAFTVGRDDLERAVEIVSEVNNEIGGGGFVYDEGVAKVSIVGAGMITNPGVASQMFEALAEEGINIEMISTSEIKVSCIIREEKTEKAVLALHRKFNLGC